MALGEAVLAEPADLLEDLLGECFRDAFFGHAAKKPLSVPLDPPRAAPGGHVATKLVGLARGVIRRHHGQADHLLLETARAVGGREIHPSS